MALRLKKGTADSYDAHRFSTPGVWITWQGQGKDEIGVKAANGKTIIAVDPQYYRPTEVDTLLGDSTKGQEKLGWQPR